MDRDDVNRPFVEECDRCGGHGHETLLRGDLEISIGACRSCGGSCEIEIESAPAREPEPFVAGEWAQLFEVRR